ncbi:MAG TPA: glutamate--cysteine ligase [Chromatiales bacterium]|nr:glutamate--cysteine ligase [Chromatiales bacterium]
MGQEITSDRFTPADFERFRARLSQETRLLEAWIQRGRFSPGPPTGGFELEAWLVDARMSPAPCNQDFLAHMGPPEATSELALFNLELNNPPERLRADGLQRLEAGLRRIWDRACATAHEIGAELVSIGILPTVDDAALSPRNMTPLKRYRALNEQVLRMRGGEPLRLDIIGREHLQSEHRDVMLESAATSFQIHFKVPAARAHWFYNASLAASAIVVGCGANAPFLFGRDLWDETRIPLFEQSVEVGGYGDAARGPLRRVIFGTGYLRHSIAECFRENLEHYPVLLPTIFPDTPPEQFAHLRLHNGTIWRWNRPLVGFDANGRPHFRIEHRVLPGPTSIRDAIANAALYYGLAAGLCMEPECLERRLPFAAARDNFYQAARLGLDARIQWFDGERRSLRAWLLGELLDLAAAGLLDLGLNRAQAHAYLDVIRARAATRRTGAHWQRAWVARHGRDMAGLTRAYLENQAGQQPVHQWD